MENYNYNTNPQGIVKIKSIRRDYNLSCIIKIISERLKKGGTIKIFEPGCGGGRNLDFLKSIYGNAIDVYGTDISETSIKYARDNISGNFSVAKTTENCFNEKFDLIIMLDILEHLPLKGEVEETIKLAKEKISETGLLFVSCPIELNKYSIIWFFKKINFWSDLTLKYYGHTLQFTEIELLGIIKKHFNISELSYGVHFLSQFDTFLFFYLPKQLLNFISGESGVSSFRESNIKIDDGDKLSWKSIFLKIYFIIRSPFLFIGFYESKLRKKSKFGAMNIHIRCC